MRVTRWRTGTVAALAVGLAMSGAPAATGLPVQDVRQGTEIFCSSSTQDSLVELSAFLPDSGATETWAAVYTENVEAWAYEGEGALNGDVFSLSYSLATESGTAVGTMTVVGDVTPVGEPHTLSERSRDGNAWNSVQGTVQELFVAATIASATGDLAGLVGTRLDCGGADVDLVFSGSDPSTRIYRSSGVSSVCEIGEDGFMTIDSYGGTTLAFLALGIDWEEGTFELGAAGTLAAAGDDFTGELEVFQPFTDPPQTVALDLAAGETLANGRFRDKNQQGAFHTRYTDYALTGTATLPDGTVVAIEDCELRRFDAMDRFSSRGGQKPGGRVPVNDAPTGAIALPEGQTTRTSTRGATEAPEAECVTEYEVPLGRTVWYRVEGTGGDVTLTTERSDFDTVIGVYDAVTLEQIACVDDTRAGRQAAVTFPTVAGTTYLVQVGGFAADWGNLVLRRS